MWLNLASLRKTSSVLVVILIGLCVNNALGYILPVPVELGLQVVSVVIARQNRYV